MLADINAEIAVLDEEIEKAKAELHTTKQERAAYIAENKPRYDEVTTVLIPQLEKQHQANQKRCSDIHKEIEDAERKVTALAEELDTKLKQYPLNEEDLEAINQIRQDIEDLTTDIEALKTEDARIEQENENIEEQLKSLRAERDTYEETVEGYDQKIAALESKIEGLEQKKLTLEQDRTTLQQKVSTLDTRQAEIQSNYDSLLANLNEKAKAYEEKHTEHHAVAETAQFVNHNAESTKHAIRGYEDRHEFLKENYGNTLRAKMGKIFMGEHSAPILAKLAPKDVKEAWNKSLQDTKGNFVYRDNNTGDLYHLKLDDKKEPLLDENGDVIRVYYDEEQSAEFYKKAWEGKGEFFRNETPFGQDPTNNFDDTERAMLKTSDIKSRLEEAQAAVNEAKDQSASDLTEAKQALEEAKMAAIAGGVDIKSVLGEKKDCDTDHDTHLKTAPNAKAAFTSSAGDPEAWRATMVVAPEHADHGGMAHNAAP